jgi:4-amino-4-deoxy-L-arabinose transferase-like glycosyltransferase
VAGLVAFGVIGFGWFALVYGRLGTEPLSYFFLRENLERFAGEAYDVGRPIWFYVPAYFAEGLPWSPLLPLALFRLLRSDGGVEAGGAASRFLAAWAALVLVPLSLSRGKIDYYLLPLYPAASLLVGRFLTHVPWRRLERAWVGTSLALLAALLGYALVYPPRVPEPWLPSPAARGAFLFVLGAAVLALLLTAVRPTPARVAAALAASVALGWFVLVVAFLPAFASAQPNRLVAADVAREKAWQPALRFAVCADPSRARRDVLLHARLAAVETCDVWGFAASTVPHLLLVTSSQAASLEALPKWRHVETYRCVPARALTLEGLFTLGEPSEVVLGANFATEDPVAERKRKREYRKGFQRAREEEAARARAKRP